jgi:signal transduction histidine kinase
VADQDRIWEPYVRLGESNPEHGGLGLGLAIVRQLSDAMGATIRVRPGTQRGTVFELLIREASYRKVEQSALG